MGFASIEEAWGDSFNTYTPRKKYNKSNKSRHTKPNRPNKSKKSRKNVNRYLSDNGNQLIEQFENFNQNVNMNSNISGNTRTSDTIYEISPNQETDEYASAYPDINQDTYPKDRNQDYQNIDSNSLYDMQPTSNSQSDLESITSDFESITSDFESITSDSKDLNDDIPNNYQNEKSLKNEIKEMNQKINFILDKISSKENYNSNDNINKNLYDIILFILFGLFIILVFESINKLALRGSENYICVPNMKIPNVE